jgi:hypothetical protein
VSLLWDYVFHTCKKNDFRKANTPCTMRHVLGFSWLMFPSPLANNANTIINENNPSEFVGLLTENNTQG